MDVACVAVPFDGWGRPGNQARAASALREAGLVDAFADLHDVTTTALVLPEGDQRRGAHTSLVNEVALVVMVDQVGSRVLASTERGQFPVVYGGDCTTLLGIVPQLNRIRPTGLVILDGHEDTMPLDVSQDGEAANTEIGLLLGITGRSLHGPLAHAVGALDTTQVALLGPRDDAWRAQHNVGSLRDTGVWSRDWREVAGAPEATGRGAVERVLQVAEEYWLHVDLDVLDPDECGSQGVPGVADNPGGLRWEHLQAVLNAAAAVRAPLGLSVAIYDPDQDPEGRDAARIVAVLAEFATCLVDPGRGGPSRSG